MKNWIGHIPYKCLWIITFTSILYLVSPKANAQNPYKDSINTFIQKADQYYDLGHLDSAIIVVKSAIQLTQSHNDEHNEANLLNKLFGIYIEQENNYNTDSIFERVSQISQTNNDTILAANLWVLKARQLMYTQQYFLSKIYYEKAGKFYVTLPIGRIQAYYYNDLGYLEAAQGFAQNALEWYFKSYKIFEEVNDTNGLANLLGNIAEVYADIQEYDKAIQYAEQSIALRLQTQEMEGLALIYGILADIYTQSGNKVAAQTANLEFLNYARRSQKKKTMAEAHSKLAFSFAEQQQYQKAIEEMEESISLAQAIHHPSLSRYYTEIAKYYSFLNDVKQVDFYNKLNIELLNQTKSLQQWRNYYWEQSVINKRFGRWQNAFEDLERYSQFKDSILSEKSKRIISELEIEYESNKKDLLIQETKNKQIQERFYYNIALLGLVILGLVGWLLFSRYKYRKRIEQKNLLIRERNRISSELHDDIGSTLSAIRLISYAASKSNNSAQTNQNTFVKIHSNTQMMMEKLSDIVWSMNPESGIVENLMSRMKTFATDIFESSNTQFEFSLSDAAKTIHLNPELLRDCYLLFKEAINNIAKHANAQQVNLHIHTQSQLLIIKIQDNGIGISTDSFHKGNGINNMKKRCQKHGGNFDINTNPNNGSMLIFSIPYAL